MRSRMPRLYERKLINLACGTLLRFALALLNPLQLAYV